MFSEKILAAFPPPAFLDFPLAGIAFSDHHIRLLQVVTVKETAIQVFAEQALELGGIIEGRIADKNIVIKALESLKKTIRDRMKGNTRIEWVRVAIPEERGYLFELDLPKVPPKEVRGAIEFKIEENVPLPADKVLFDYIILESESTAEMLKIAVSAVQKVDIESYIDVLAQVGIGVLGIQTLSQAVARTLLPSGMKGAGSEPVLITHFGSGKVGLYLAYRGVVRFSSTVTLVQVWQNDLASVATEIKKVAAYWQDELSADGREVPQHIIVCGSHVTEDIAKQLAPLLNQEVTLANVWINVFDLSHTVPEIPYLDSLAYAAAIGSAIPSKWLV